MHIPNAPAPSSSLKQGFTLIELAIVIVIIGIIIGASTLARGMMRAGQLNAVTVEVERYTQAVHDFQYKYGGLPGDMPNAEDFWGTDTDGCPGVYRSTSQVGTCNGNGDGYVAGSCTSIDPEECSEDFRAWQQLSNAGIIEGTYTGVTGTISSDWAIVPGVNAPRSKIPQGGYAFRYKDTDGDAQNWLWASHAFLFSSFINTPANDPVITPVEAWNLDSKIDDGFPAFGKVVSQRLPSDCTTSGDAADSAYNMTDKRELCLLWFQEDF